jgi:hypothetical protein
MPVEVGLFNTRFIEITSGLNPGDRVLLSPPLDSEGADIDGSILKEGETIPTNQVTVAQLPIDRESTETGGAPPFGGPASFEPGDGFNPGGGSAVAGAGGGGNRAGGFNREEMMKQYDTDGDGQLSDEERTAMRARFGGRSGGGQGGGQRGGFNREEMMKQYDKDGDGQLSEDERAAMSESFNRMRNNSSGDGGAGGQRRPRPAPDDSSR